MKDKPKKKVVLFGAGATGKLLFQKLSNQYDFLYVTDNDPSNYGKIMWDSLPCRNSSEIRIKNYDYIIIASSPGLDEIYNQLIVDFSVPEEMIIRKYVEGFVKPRTQFIEKYALYLSENNVSGNVAEIGVFRGEFAKEINRVFPDSILYLFDTFSGFDNNDIAVDEKLMLSSNQSNRFSVTTEETVLQKMPNVEKVIMKKGYFPKTFDLYDESFIFVSLDVDLFQPTMEALKLFYPRLKEKCCILVHDYFSVLDTFSGVKAAVEQFIYLYNNTKDETCPVVLPIGDNLSVAIIKP